MTSLRKKNEEMSEVVGERESETVQSDEDLPLEDFFFGSPLILGSYTSFLASLFSSRAL